MSLLKYFMCTKVVEFLQKINFVKKGKTTTSFKNKLQCHCSLHNRMKAPFDYKALFLMALICILRVYVFLCIKLWTILFI